jgi:hypothetical protein
VDWILTTASYKLIWKQCNSWRKIADFRGKCAYHELAFRVLRGPVLNKRSN